MTLVLLVRHAETTHNEQGILQGHLDIQLSERGRQQARRLSERMQDEPITAIYSSDLRRATHTAQIISEPHGIDPVAIPELAEQHLGKWQGKPKKMLLERLTDQELNWREWKPTDGESWEELADRVLPTVSDLCERHADEVIALICHGKVNEVILEQATEECDVHTDQDNACLNILKVTTEGSWSAKQINDVAHLSKEVE